MILPKRTDLDKAKVLERKREIDNGLELARQVDSLRTTLAEEKKLYAIWHEQQKQELQKQLQGLDDGIVAKKKELVLLEEQRQKLVEPLDLEWLQLREQQDKLHKDIDVFNQKKILLQKNIDKLNKDIEKVRIINDRAQQNEAKTKQIQIDTQKLKDLAQEEYEKAWDERSTQQSDYEAKEKLLSHRITEYEVAIKTIEIREQQVQDKEAELITKEKDLERRLKNLERHEQK